MTSAFQSARRTPSPTLRRCSTTILPTTLLLLLVYFSAFVLVSAFTTPSATTTTTTRTTTLFHNDHYVARFHGSSTTSRISIRSFPISSSHKSAKSDYNEATSRTATTTASPTVISPSDIEHMKHAIKLARIGYGNTFPNPAVGCVLVRHSATTTTNDNNNKDDNDNDDDDTGDVVIGSGFHPKAGMPHAEVFALLEACGHVEDGVASARSVMGMDDDDNDNNNDNERKDIYNLLAAYKSPDGPTSLFQNRLLPSLFQDGSNQKGEVTAYVTLEPCCHTGRTPPCAVSLLVAGVSRVVIGYSDPNPRVDGGGIALLKQQHHQQQERGEGGKVVQVDLMSRLYSTERVVSYEEKEVAKECASLVEYFVKRIASMSGEEENGVDGANGASSSISGAQKRALRRIAGTKKNEGTMTKIDWPRDKKKSTSTSSFSANTTEEEDDDDEDDNNNTNNNLEQEEQQQQQLQNQLSVQTHHRFLENLDNSLWDHELVLVRLNAIVKKKKDAKVVGTWLGEVLKAHVAQVVGHTVLLYREGRPKVLDLEELLVNNGGGEQ